MKTGLHGPGLSAPRAPGPGEPVRQAEGVLTATDSEIASGPATTSETTHNPATTPGTASAKQI